MSVSFLGAQAMEAGTIASSRPMTCTGSTANTKGSYAVQFTATTYPAAWVLVSAQFPGSTGTDMLIDVAVGAASSEQVVIANLPHSSNSSTSSAIGSWLFPLFIPAGSRVATRIQTTGLNQILDVGVNLFAPMFGSELGLGQVEACGAVTATSLGTSVDPGGTASTKGTPQELIAATTFAYKWACISVNHTNVLASATSWTVDIMVGAGGAEVVSVPDIPVHANSIADTNPAIGVCFPWSIPAGTRVSARAQCSSTTTPNRNLEIVLHGAG